MPKDIEKVLPTSKVEVASGIGLIPSEAKLHNQLAPSDQSGGLGSTSVASKPRSIRGWTRRNNRHPARPDDGAVRHPKWKRPNAQKSGVFAEPLILPGEDPREFEALHAALIEEWTPSGLSEESKVFGIADAEWRKLRSRRFAQAKAISNSMRPDHPAFDEARSLIAFGRLMCHKPETVFAEYASNYLRTDTIRYLQQKFPRQNFESTADWVAAVAEEIKSALLPGTPGFAALDLDRLDPFTDAFRSDIVKMHSFFTTIHMREFLDDDLDQCSRLDARIARLTKDLIEIKTMKQMLRRTSTNGRTDNR
jgi:hypothetical protein